MDIAAMQDVLNTLRGHDVSPHELYDALNDILEYANNIYWETCMVSLPVLYMLKDTVWFNIEHLGNAGLPEGYVTLSNLGRRFPVFAKLAVSDVYVDADDTAKLFDELTEIMAEWSPEFTLAKLEINSRENMIHSPETIGVMIHEAGKNSPYNMSFAGYGARSVILDTLGHTQHNRDVIVCTKETKIGEFGTNNMLYHTVHSLHTAARRAKELEKGIRLEIAAYEDNQY